MSNYLIVGGSSGIGKSIVNELQVTDCQIFATYHSHKMESEGNCRYFHLNVLDEKYDFDLVPDRLEGR